MFKKLFITLPALMVLTLSSCNNGNTPEVTKIEIATSAKVTNYKTGDYFNVEGLIIKATWNDGTTSTPGLGDGGYSTSIAVNYRFIDSDIGNDKPVTITYGGKTASYNINVTKGEKFVYKVEINTKANKDKFTVFEAFTSAGLTLKATWSDGTTSIVGDDRFSISPYDGYIFEPSDISSKEGGLNNAVVTFEGAGLTYPIIINPTEERSPEKFYEKYNQFYNNFQENFDPSKPVPTPLTPTPKVAFTSIEVNQETIFNDELDIDFKVVDGAKVGVISYTLPSDPKENQTVICGINPSDIKETINGFSNTHNAFFYISYNLISVDFEAKSGVTLNDDLPSSFHMTFDNYSYALSYAFKNEGKYVNFGLAYVPGDAVLESLEVVYNESEKETFFEGDVFKANDIVIAHWSSKVYITDTIITEPIYTTDSTKASRLMTSSPNREYRFTKEDAAAGSKKITYTYHGKTVSFDVKVYSSREEITHDEYLEEIEVATELFNSNVELGKTYDSVIVNYIKDGKPATGVSEIEYTFEDNLYHANVKDKFSEDIPELSLYGSVGCKVNYILGLITYAELYYEADYYLNLKESTINAEFYAKEPGSEKWIFTSFISYSMDGYLMDYSLIYEDEYLLDSFKYIKN